MNKKEENKRTKIEGLVSQTFSFLDEEHKSIDENPFFYTKLMGRINSEESEPMFKFLKGAYILPALLGLMLLFNIYTYYNAPTGSSTGIAREMKVSSIDSTYDISSFSEEYNLDQENIWKSMLN